MFAIGLTGGIGSGKTTVSDRFAAHGVGIIDTDRIAHLITAPGGAAMAPLAARFGAEYIAADGALDRAKMRARVFSDPQAKAALEAITHPLIRAATQAAAAQAGGPYQLFVVPLLVESGKWKQRVDRILVVDCAVATQIHRVMQRNGFTRQEVLAIIAQQASRDERLAAADDVIVNDGCALPDLYAQIDTLHQRYLALARA